MVSPYLGEVLPEEEDEDPLLLELEEPELLEGVTLLRVGVL